MKNRLAALFLALSAVPAMAAPPNVLILLADDLGYSDLGCYGGEIATPNLDKLAANGLRFTQFYNTGRCWPTRSALMTGYYPQQVRMDAPTMKRGQDLPAWGRTLPQMLKPAGYRCYHSGKWHIDVARRQVADAGFDHSYYVAKQENHFTPDKHFLDDKPLPPPDPKVGWYSSVDIASHAIDFLKEHAAEHSSQPFLSYVAFTAPHFPIQAKPEDIAKYKDRYALGWDQLRQERYERQKKMGLVHTDLARAEPGIRAPSGNEKTPQQLGEPERFYAGPWAELNAAEKKFQVEKMAIHAAMIDRMDQEVGRILDQLKTMNALDNTIIFFLSDNGASAEIMVRGGGHDKTAPLGSAASYLCLGPGWSTMCNTPHRRHKIWNNEGGISTPFIVHWPAGITARGELRTDVGHVVDFAPTLLDLAGTSQTKASDAAPAFPGISLTGAFQKDGSTARDYTFFHHAGSRALRVGDMKVVSAPEDQDRWQLYDLKADRAEQHDLSADRPDLLQKMTARWTELLTQFIKDAAISP